MERKTKISRRSFSFQVTEEGKLYTLSWELPKKTKYVRGIMLSSDWPDRVYFRGANKIEIGGEEIFPEGFDSRLLMTAISVAPNLRFYDLGEVAAGDLSFKVRYQDSKADLGGFGRGYKVTYSLLLEEEV